MGAYVLAGVCIVGIVIWAVWQIRAVNRFCDEQEKIRKRIDRFGGGGE